MSLPSNSVFQKPSPCCHVNQASAQRSATKDVVCSCLDPDFCLSANGFADASEQPFWKKTSCAHRSPTFLQLHGYRTHVLGSRMFWLMKASLIELPKVVLRAATAMPTHRPSQMLGRCLQSPSKHLLTCPKMHHPETLCPSHSESPACLRSAGFASDHPMVVLHQGLGWFHNSKH